MQRTQNCTQTDEEHRKKIHVEDLPEKDSQGRVRFHGAFTGGFSAGYFNTVGSKDGWTPGSFSSSRSLKAEQQTACPEDFMDDEDIGEYGIAPRNITAREDFTSGRSHKRVHSSNSASVIPGEPVLAEVISPETSSIGVRLLMIMGWKSGQGIGPRVKRKIKKRQKVGAGKMYGCALPPSASDSEVSDSETASCLRGLTFAPEDTSTVSFVSKDDHHGIGYRGLDPWTDVSHHSTVHYASSSHGKRGIKGHAFGVGALEEEDEEVYSVDHISDYHQTLDQEQHLAELGWTAPKSGQSSLQGNISSLGKLLEGFKLASKHLADKKIFPPPQISASHAQRSQQRMVQSRENRFTVQESVREEYKEKKIALNCVTRGLLLGELPPTVSADVATNQLSMNNPVHLVELPSAGGTIMATPDVETPYLPFAKDPPKQKRYEQYLAQLKCGSPDPFEGVFSGNLTEWELNQEKEEFSRSSKLYGPLSAMMASRFTTAQYHDNDLLTQLDTSPQGQERKSEQLTAAEMKMFGRLTRESLEWHPHTALCKRFNVPHPYPGSTIAGLPEAKKNPTSGFTDLKFENRTDELKTTNSTFVTNEMPVTTRAVQIFKPVRFGVAASKGRLTTANIFAAYFDEVDRKEVSSAGTGQSEMDLARRAEAHKDTSDLAVEEKLASSEEQSGGRAAMDLFKAIFQESEHSSSDEEDDTTMEETSQAEASLLTTPPINGSLTKDSAGAVENVEERLLPSEQDTREQLGTQMFGPVLPPHSQHALSRCKSPQVSSIHTDDTEVLSVHRGVKLKHLNKHKKKHKHRKEKKEKHRKRLKPVK